MNPTQPRPCQFTVAAGGVICGVPSTWCNVEGSHECFFCAEHKAILAADETYGGEWFELQHSPFNIHPSS